MTNRYIVPAANTEYLLARSGLKKKLNNKSKPPHGERSNLCAAFNLCSFYKRFLSRPLKDIFPRVRKSRFKPKHNHKPAWLTLFLNPFSLFHPVPPCAPKITKLVTQTVPKSNEFLSIIQKLFRRKQRSSFN